MERTPEFGYIIVEGAGFDPLPIPPFETPVRDRDCYIIQDVRDGRTVWWRMQVLHRNGDHDRGEYGVQVLGRDGHGNPVSHQDGTFVYQRTASDTAQNLQKEAARLIAKDRVNAHRRMAEGMRIRAHDGNVYESPANYRNNVRYASSAPRPVRQVRETIAPETVAPEPVKRGKRSLNADVKEVVEKEARKVRGGRHS